MLHWQESTQSAAVEFENPAFDEDVYLPGDEGARGYQNGDPLRLSATDQQTQEGTSVRYYWTDGKRTANSGSKKQHVNKRKDGSKKAKLRSKHSVAEEGGEWSFGVQQNEGRHSGSNLDVEIGRREGDTHQVPNSFHGNVLMRSTSHQQHSSRNYNLQFSSNRSMSMMF